ncbi:MAG: hypothetical protein AMK70_09425 [Nitrospira bacterium SG8_35_1]|jgi:hypothetical protein|nr:MAG: hypothetical protein AMK70_09425 [Nitrospira bacterium SG8_35_1]UCH44394.1 MAG: hypothetical protein JSV11_08820 [Nitrospiraceae bacterium]
MNNKLKKFDPAVDKRILIALSGTIWTFVGIILCNLSLNWLLDSAGEDLLVIAAAGIVAALLIGYFGFLKIVNRNIDRIVAKPSKVCIFAFQPWKSYFIVIIMITLGIFLRSSPVPKKYLSIIYSGFGGAMILSSLKYHWVFIKMLITPQK